MTSKPKMTAAIEEFEFEGFKYRASIVRNKNDRFDVIIECFTHDEWEEESATFNLTSLSQAVEVRDEDINTIINWSSDSKERMN